MQVRGSSIRSEVGDVSGSARASRGYPVSWRTLWR